MSKQSRWMIEHLPPRYSISELDAQTRYNYQKAINFYDSRYKSFQQQLSQDLRIMEASFMERLNKDISERWDKKIQGNFWGSVGAVQSGGDINQYLEKIKNNYDREFLSNVIAKYKKQYEAGKGGNPASLLGQEYENYVNSLLQNLVGAMASFTNDQIKDMIQVTGSKKSKSVATKEESNIRPDIIFSMSSEINSDYEKANGVLYKNGIAVELQESIDLGEASEELIDSLAKEYNAAGLYGFSLKVWKNSNNKKFMESTPLRDELSKDFSVRDSNNRLHNWEVNYITAYMLWKVSNNILNFMGPTDIGLITGVGFQGFNTWLGNHMFYMKVQVNNVRGKSNYSARPSISDTGVYILDFVHDTQKINWRIKNARKGSGQIIVKTVNAS